MTAPVSQRDLMAPPALQTPELDEAIARAEASAVVVWRGEHVPFAEVPERIAGISNRDERDLYLDGYIQAAEAVNPLYDERRERWRTLAAAAGSDVLGAAAETGVDPRALAIDLERFSVHTETPYFAALRRYLALVDIEQGDGTIADLWHITRGVSWSHWFGERETRRAVAAAGRAAAAALDLDGWRSAEALLYGAPAGTDPTVAAAISETYAALPGDPHWLETELGVTSREVAPLADFVAFVRLWRFRRALAVLHYELRLYREDDPALLRAYYSGIVGHTTGVEVPEAAYLRDIAAPLASARRLRVLMLAATLAEVLESRMGPAWWRAPAGSDLIAELGSARNIDDALAHLGYDVLDWRPVLRQIRTRLIGEMSGYGGPNITTRAGTRKV
ncbi:MAG TPA: hypothetical protein VGA26_01450 [Candidatus Limnocylindria bacterium]